MWRDGYPIEQLETLHAIETGITLSPGMIEGMIPDYEEYAAMIAANHNDETWKAIGYRRRARAVAFYRLNKLVSLHVDEARATAEIDRLQNMDR